MKTSDLPDIQKIDDGYLEAEPSDTYYAVIEDCKLFGLQRSYQRPYLWDMFYAIDDPFFKIEIHIYDNYHDQ